MEKSAVILNTTAMGEIFIIPNTATKLCDLKGSMKEGSYKAALTNGLVLTDDDCLVQVWITSKDLHSDNCADHGFVVHGVSGDYRVASSVSSPVMSYIPARMLKDVKEGMSFTARFVFESNDIRTNIEMTLTAAQTKYRYSEFGRFEDALRHVGAIVDSDEDEPEWEGHTMRKFMEYIQIAECDGFGFCYPFPDAKNIRFHICNTKRQVNIAINDKTIVNLLFGETEVGIVKVTDEIADYDHILHVNVDSSMELVHQQLESVLGSANAFEIKKVIKDTIDMNDRYERNESIAAAIEIRDILMGAYVAIEDTLGKYSGMSASSKEWIQFTLEHINQDKDIACKHTVAGE